MDFFTQVSNLILQSTIISQMHFLVNKLYLMYAIIFAHQRRGGVPCEIVL